MIRLYNQHLAQRFGTELARSLRSGEWETFDVAVAWVRSSGTARLLPALQHFLDGNGTLRMIVGVDIENTSKEGIKDLLSLKGKVSLYIYHNEYPSDTFHPKIYLFRNCTDARLIVGSNNITAGGLFTNTEAGLQVDVPITEDVIEDARMAFDSWIEESEGLVKELDDEFLAELVSQGYVLSEKQLRKRRKANENKKTAKRRASGKKPLFKRKPVPVPKLCQSAGTGTGTGMGGDGTAGDTSAAIHTGGALLIRVRRASAKSRRTQVQFPFRLIDTAYFQGLGSIQSIKDNRTHQLRPANTRRKKQAGKKNRRRRNTLKVEIPEIKTFKDPVLRLHRTATRIVYEAYDADDAQGRLIMDSLERGRHTEPPTTILTRPSNPTRSTWYRFI